MRDTRFHNDEGGAKKPISQCTIQQTRNSGRPCRPLAPTLRCRPATGAQGQGPKGPRAKGLAHRVAVGMVLTAHPPHRSRREELPHRAPALGQTRRLATCRIRSSALCRAARLCVRSPYCPTRFPLASSLPSSHSATAFDIGSGTADVRLCPSPRCVPSDAVAALFM